MTQNGDARLDADGLMQLLADLDRAARALGHHDHEVRVARETRILDALHHVPLEVHRMLGDKHDSGADRDPHIEGQEARVAAHDLHDGAALVRLHGVAQLVDALDGGVAGRVKADGVIGAADIVVDGGGNADDGDAETRKLERAAEGSVAADGHDGVQTQHPARGDRLFPARLGHEIFASGGIEDRAAAGENVADAGAVELHKVAGDQAMPAPADADALDAAGDGGTHDRAHGRVHARRVAAAGQNADSFDFVHIDASCFLCSRSSISLMFRSCYAFFIPRFQWESKYILPASSGSARTGDRRNLTLTEIWIFCILQ